MFTKYHAGVFRSNESTGSFRRSCKFFGVIFPLLVAAAQAQEYTEKESDWGGRAKYKILAAVAAAVLIILFKFCRACSKEESTYVGPSVSNEPVPIQRRPSEEYPRHNQPPALPLQVPMVRKLYHRMKKMDRARNEGMTCDGPSLPSGRYIGTRDTSDGQLEVVYDLIFSFDGVTGTMSTNGADYSINGIYNPETKEVEWGESHPTADCTYGDDIYHHFQEVDRLQSSEPPPAGCGWHTEVSMKVVSDSGPDSISLVGNYINSNYSEGNQKLEFVSSSMQTAGPSVTIEIPPLARSNSVKSEPLLEKEMIVSKRSEN